MGIYETLRDKPLSQLTGEEREAARSVAREILRADYYADVRGCAESIREAIAGGEVPDRESLLERIHEECDGHERVIYTHLNMETLLFSDNDDAYAEDFGADGMVKDGAINWAGLAYAAFERDVIDQLEAEGVDVNAYPGPAEDEDDGPEGDDDAGE
jgi:hypothetical protein